MLLLRLHALQGRELIRRIHDAFLDKFLAKVAKAPEVWRTVPRDSNIKLSVGETQTQSFEVTLPYDASSGRQRILS